LDRFIAPLRRLARSSPEPTDTTARGHDRGEQRRGGLVLLAVGRRARHGDGRTTRQGWARAILDLTSILDKLDDAIDV